MKTTVDIPDNILVELIENTSARTKKDAIIIAIKEYNQKKNMARLADVVGTFERFMLPEELDQNRESH